MEWLEEHNYDSKQLKEGQKYTIVFITIVTAFIFSTYLILVYGYHTSGKLRNLYIAVYAALFSIVGGLIGGLLTLEGVRRTVYAQKEIEAIKLIPNKLLHLYKLKKKDGFFKDIREKVENWRWHLSYYPPPRNDDRSKETYNQLFELIIDYKKLKEFVKRPYDSEEEYKIIEISSEIDMDLYYRVVQIFDDLDKLLKTLDQTLLSVEYEMLFPDQKILKNVVILFDECITVQVDDNGDKRFINDYTFINQMNSSDITPGQIINAMKNAIPNLEAIDTCLDTGLNEVHNIMETKEKEFKKNKKGTL